MNRTALVFGATGLTGSLLVEELTRNEAYKKVVVFSRNNVKTSHPKLTRVAFDIENIDAVSGHISGDDLFCCLGTTIRKAGSQEEFLKVDLHAPAKIASVASANRVKRFLVISSIGASATSTNFYLRTKGEMEKAVTAHDFEHTAILRPSMILGKRSEFRAGEEIGKIIFRPLSPLLTGKLRKYRAIKAETIMSAMIRIALNPQKETVFESDRIEKLGGPEKKL